ncbi:GNAT family N-acetyltransferase [Streptomyces canus]|uniref:GNAT family N-acetyltransferase n=1 Tax=Streptomyces canus TaxID=58343 RepID=UPI0027D869F4|nr:GNAT family N-acetyltransferase [Streptomyces canus]
MEGRAAPSCSRTTGGETAPLPPSRPRAGRKRTRQDHAFRQRALVAVSSGFDVLGGLLLSAKAPVYRAHWLVVSEKERGKGAGRALMTEAIRKFVQGPGQH